MVCFGGDGDYRGEGGVGEGRGALKEQVGEVGFSRVKNRWHKCEDQV